MLGLTSLAESSDVKKDVRIAVRAIADDGKQRGVHFENIGDIRDALRGEGFSEASVELLRVGKLAALFENQEMYAKDVWLEKRCFSLSAHVQVLKKECWFVRMPIR
ncbi:MAG: hypothetical protein EOP84_31880 [Verrucomicrobiaceae bacterium]|nr:MAG: hypothetical protein EOP84_31880 [Verrucomicrobiaceae bacterium]